MMTKQFNWMMTLTLFVAVLMASCQKEDVFSEDTVENYSEIDLRDSEESNGYQCYEFNYPIILNLGGGDTIGIESKEALLEFTQEWRADNPGARKPRILLPVDVTLADGTIITVETPMQLKKIQRFCKRKRARGFAIKHCFNIIYPANILFPDGTEVTYENQEEHMEAMKTWRDENPDATERPKFVFPQDVELPDGSVITVESAEHFKQLARQCIENRPHGPCYKLIFPIVLDLPDGTSLDIANPQSLKEALEAWKESNPASADRPEISYPHDVELPNGEVVTLQNADDAKKLLVACNLKKRFPALVNNGCFTVNLPVQFQTMHGDTIEIGSLEDLVELIEESGRRPKNHRAKNYPKIILPFDVTLEEDGSVVTIENFEDLMEAFDNCREE